MPTPPTDRRPINIIGAAARIVEKKNDFLKESFSNGRLITNSTDKCDNNRNVPYKKYVITPSNNI